MLMKGRIEARPIVAVGYYIVFLALRENRWAASIIEVQPGQRVISTGPYGIVRHPMYSGGVLMILATSLALGSLWAFVCAVLLCGVIAARLLDEERYLSKDLPGYEGYCSISTDSPRLVGFVLRVLCRYFMSCQSNEDPSTMNRPRGLAALRTGAISRRISGC